MTALTGDRALVERHWGDRNIPVLANVVIWENAMVALDIATGLLKPAGGVTGLPTDIVLGAARRRADNRLGANSAISCEFKSDAVRCFFNSGGADTITIADIGKDVYAVDDQTLALTNGTNTRARAGKVHNVDERGVWLRFDR